jgi:hypothetical protein
VLAATFFEVGVKKDLISFEMTGIVIPNGREESFPHVFFLGDRQIMNKVIMKNR